MNTRNWNIERIIRIRIQREILGIGIQREKYWELECREEY